MQNEEHETLTRRDAMRRLKLTRPELIALERSGELAFLEKSCGLARRYRLEDVEAVRMRRDVAVPK